MRSSGKESGRLAGKAILEVGDNQLRAGDPPETRETFNRLLNEGYSENEAKRLIANVVLSEVYDVLKEGRKSDPFKYTKRLNNLPAMPWETEEDK
ncbi:MAG: hypothetical protein ACM3UR_09025 [Bacteroidota bacterium]|jgi:uncharacterized protein with ATP-grasp and redox domains|nr:hypothetical protein [Ignavibacteria bacterium]MCU7500323.1 hypothetical protein [Ignavibacteria bacterium]MCU7511678.1 hypothetical protein [Ignavibacteria bacterium]MCU7525518.1 hypothetical protein [Ignavibacteria bacterium]